MTNDGEATKRHSKGGVHSFPSNRNDRVAAKRQLRRAFRSIDHRSKLFLTRIMRRTVEKKARTEVERRILREARRTPREIFKNLNNILLYYRGWGDSKRGREEERVVGRRGDCHKSGAVAVPATEREKIYNSKAFHKTLDKTLRPRFSSGYRDPFSTASLATFPASSLPRRPRIC